ncbi:MAG TPA: hypothetical protein VMW34_18810 [Anaerolineales bacterium]|nr:hypothetical protein [Anaerolineales bacterium]
MDSNPSFSYRRKAPFGFWESPSSASIQRRASAANTAQTRTESSKPPVNGTVIVRNRFQGSFTNSK